MPSRDQNLPVRDLSSTRRLALTAVAVVVVPLIALALIEGASSMLVVGRRVSRWAAVSAEASRWLEHHPRIGAVPRANVYEPNMYGPGVYLRTNAQGFRNERDFSAAVPEGRRRLVCSGDSYTLGQEVSNHEAWCERLATFDAALETVNLGVSGYGWDQAFLRYQHQGASVAHDLHLFAFITDDLYRMRRRGWVWPWEKPLLTVREGTLVVPEVVPCVPCAHPLLPAIAVGLSQLRSVELMAGLGRRLGLGHRADPEPELRELADRTIRALAAGSVPLVLVHLPVVEDYSDDVTGPWREYLRGAAAREKALYIDLIEPLRQLPPDSIPIVFLPAQSDPGRHYTAAGHEWVARQLYARLADHLRRITPQGSRAVNAAP